MNGNPRQSWILDSTLRVPDSSYYIPIVSGILHGFLELFSEFQCPGFRIPREKLSRFRNPDSLTLRATGKH